MQGADQFYCALSFGDRSSSGQGKGCHQHFDNNWWDFGTRDVVALDPDVSDEEAPAVAPGGTELAASSAAGARLLELLGNLMGEAGSRSETHLAGIDSLRVLTLCRQLRLAVPGLALRPQDVFGCTNVGELLSRVEAFESQEPLEPEILGGEEGTARAVWFAPGQVNNTCKWLYGCRGLLDETCFRRAAARLLVRHEGLRATMQEGGMEVLRFLRDVGPFQTLLWRHLESKRPALGWWKKLVASSLKKSWPKSKPLQLTREFLDECIKVVRCRSWREVESLSRISDVCRRAFRVVNVL